MKNTLHAFVMIGSLAVATNAVAQTGAAPGARPAGATPAANGVRPAGGAPSGGSVRPAGGSPSTDGATTGAGGAAASATVTDAQIAAIVVAANQVDITAGRAAKSKSKNKEVKAFAALMVADHTAVNKEAIQLVRKLKVKPEESATSTALKADGKQTLADMRKLKGAEFDTAYVDNEVRYHQQVLSVIDTVLIPNAQNEDLKAMLEKYRPAFEAHLHHAKGLQSTLTSGATDTGTMGTGTTGSRTGTTGLGAGTTGVGGGK